MKKATRLRAGLIHLSASACVAIPFGIFVFFVWYPAPLAGIVGVTGIVAMLLGIDVVLGPLLTLLVYKPGKKRLMLDLGLIVALQICAFAYGAWCISVARPAWIVFTGYRFDLVQANDIDQRFLRVTKEEYRNPPFSGPKWVAAHPPSDLQQRNQLIMESVGGGIDMPQRPDLYAPLSGDLVRLRANAQPISKLTEIHGVEVMRSFLARWPEANGYFPLKTRSGYGSVLVNRDGAQILAVTDLKPFP